MAHLVCKTHGQRSRVEEHSSSTTRHRVYQVLHRSDRVRCTDDTVRHGKQEFSLVTVALGLMGTHYAASERSNWTESSPPAQPKRRRPRRR